MRIGGGSDDPFGMMCPTRGERSPKPSVRAQGALTLRAAQPTNARGEGPTGLAAIPQRQRAPHLRGPAHGTLAIEALRGLRATLALPAGNVGVHGLVLPAVPPLAVDGELRFTAGLLAHPARRIGLVGSRKVPDGRPSESLVRHADSHPFPGPDAGSRPPQYPLRTAPGSGSFPRHRPIRPPACRIHLSDPPALSSRPSRVQTRSLRR
jgi:hypothetical protein